MPTMNKMQLWLRDYEAQRHSKQPKELKESWQSSKYDFSDPDVRLAYVPEMGCSVGGCISALKKLWKSYKIAGRNGEPRGDIAWNIRNLQGSLGIKRSHFPEIEGMDDDEENILKSEEDEENFGTNEPYCSEEDKQLLKEELEAQKENDDWWFS
ncbi:MAG: hypothetical protein WA364_03030 [Candidatus Nitrosopolaris sp.]